MEQRLHGFFDELEKIADPLTSMLLALSTAKRYDKAKGLHKRRQEFLNRGIPVSWADLGMRPHGSRR
jgi:hypothetical protein